MSNFSSILLIGLLIFGLVLGIVLPGEDDAVAFNGNLTGTNCIYESDTNAKICFENGTVEYYANK